MKNIQKVPFTEKEIAKLSNERNTDYGCFGICLVIFLALTAGFVLLGAALINGDVGSFLRGAIVLAPIAFFTIYGLIKFSRSGLKHRADLKDGQKQIVVAPVEGKRVKFERGKKGAKRHRTFFLRAGGFTVRVPKTLYDETKEGELIQFEIAPHSEKIFSEAKKV